MSKMFTGDWHPEMERNVEQGNRKFGVGLVLGLVVGMLLYRLLFG